MGEALCANLQGLSVYPATKGEPALRQAIAQWLAQRYSIPAPDADREVLPVLGSREALFAFAQAVVDPDAGALVICPNPFYQIYEGATLLAGATPYYVNADRRAISLVTGRRCPRRSGSARNWFSCARRAIRPATSCRWRTGARCSSFRTAMVS